MTLGKERQEAQDHWSKLLEYLGENPKREGLADTPKRILKSWDHLFGGYHKEPAKILTTFSDDDVVPRGQIILLKNIEMYSTCEHHFLPFFGKAHVAYIPRDRVIGISKLARIVEIFARRLQIQERIGLQVTEALMKHLNAEAAACIIEAQHMCMTARGVEKQNSVMTTSSLQGPFLTDPQKRNELYSLIGLSR